MKPNGKSHHAGAFLTGAGVAAGLVYVLDPDRGPARRALVRDKARHLAREERQILESGTRDLRNRLRGAAARVSRSTHPDAPSDFVLAERVRSSIGRAISHPGSVHVMVDDGCVALTGPILRDEHERLLRAVFRVRGVRELDDQLSVHDEPGHVPGLQGAGARPPRPIVRRESWPASLRLLSSVFGAGAAMYGLARRDPLGVAIAIAGGLAFVRAASDAPLARLLPSGSAAIDVRREVVVRAPIDVVYELWAGPARYPEFMSHVRSVQPLGDGGGRLHWTVVDASGRELGYETETTSGEPGLLLAWRTVPGQSIEHGAVVRFERIDEASTRVDVHFAYRAPRGASHRPLVRLLGADPDAALDHDLARMRAILEGRGEAQALPDS